MTSEVDQNKERHNKGAQNKGTPTEETTLSRRKVVTSLALAAGGMAASACSSSEPETAAPVPVPEPAARWDFDLNNPQDAIKAYTKITGSTAEEEVYLQYYGNLFSVIPGEEQRVILGLKGIVRLRWRPNGDGTYYHENYDQGLFCDPESGEVLEEYNNPFTGEVNIPLHYKSGPGTATVGVGESHENPMTKTWRVSGNQITLTDYRFGRFTNPVKPAIWPMASTGEFVNYSINTIYFANVDDVANPDLHSVDSDHNWTFITNYPAWMKVGEMPGNVVWAWAGRKFSNRDQIDPYIEQQVLKQTPGFFTEDKPWPERSDGWTQYTRERKPS